MNLKKINCEVVGCSIDSQYTHHAWVSTSRKQGGLGDIKIPLLADVARKLARDYHVLLEDKGYACRGTFIIGSNGAIRHISMNDPPVGRNVKEVLRLVQAYQYTDEHGEVCPSSWKKSGDATIKPDPSQKMEYFSKKESNSK